MGDIVRVKHMLDVRPKMLVQSIDRNDMSEKKLLLGVTCVWFSTKGELQKARFNTKDLEKI